MFEVKTVIGRHGDGTTKYEDAIRECATENAAIDVAIRALGTQDIFEGETRIARVHPDGGIDRIR